MHIDLIKRAGTFISLAAILTIAACNNSATEAEKTEPTASTAEKIPDTVTTVKARKTGKVTASLEKREASAAHKKGPDGIYESVEVQPEYPGGEAALSSFVSNNLVYPETALESNSEGTVKVQFIINENGKVSNALVVGPEAGNGLDKAALDVINKMENWTPGKVNGKNVKTRLVLPVVFRLE